MQRSRAHVPGRLPIDCATGQGQASRPASAPSRYLTKTSCRSHRAHRPLEGRQRWQKRGPAVRVVGLAGAGHRTCKKTVWHGDHGDDGLYFNGAPYCIAIIRNRR
eukprot:scaffold3641_cov116-Isochrysis_galbana.AAC.3